MTRIVHLSDPHFGAENPLLLRPLVEAVVALQPDLVVVSGDLTQRARPAQFHAAADWLRSLPAPVLAVAGNHDVPLWNLWLRLVHPWRRWRGGVGLPLSPQWQSDSVAVVAVNTANPRAWKNGRIGQADIAHVTRAFAAAGARRRVLVMHHPLQGPPEEPPALAGAAEAMPALASAGVELVLSGHLHSTFVAPLGPAPHVLSVQAGTCLSHRVRGDGNAFNLIRLVPGGVVLTHHRACPDRVFRADADLAMALGPTGWAKVQPS